MFTGQNNLQQLPEGLSKVVEFLNEKSATGEFVFSESFESWAEHEEIVKPFGSRVEYSGYYFAVSLAYISYKKGGKIAIPDDVNIWRWAWSLRLLSVLADWTPDFYINVVSSFVGKKDDIDALLRESTQLYAKTDFDKGVKVLESLPLFRDNILAGLIENDFDRYCEFNNPHDNQAEFMNVFCLAYDISKETVNKAFDFVDKTSFKSSQSAMHFLLKVHSVLENERKFTCEEIIRKLLQERTTVDYSTAISNWVYGCKDDESFVEECLLLFIKALDKEHVSELQAIDNAIVVRSENSELIQRLIIQVAESLSPKDIFKMENCLHFLNCRRDQFLNFVLSFILHPKGTFRFAGRRLWDEYHFENTEFNAADLDEPLQYLFIYTMLQDFGNPETRLPKVLPLLKTNKKIVKGVLMKYLLLYADDYMGHVTKAIDNLDIKCKEAKMIKEYVKLRGEAIDNRQKIKELSPEYTNYGAFKEAQRIEKEHLQNTFKDVESGHKSVLEQFTHKVLLARGNTWQMQDGRIQKLPLISFSMPSRMLLQSYSPLEKNKWLSEILKDWNDTTRDN